MKLDRLDEFSQFLDREGASAIGELDKVAEKSRQHLQKLVYTNIVDRFDSTIDHFLLDNALEDPLLSEALAELREPISEGQLLQQFANAERVNEHIEERVALVLRNGILRLRHANKLKKVFELFVPGEDHSIPRVNPSTAAITKKFKPQNNKIPCSITGYTDWLYSRRNAIVHGGGGVAMLQNDVAQMKKLYKSEVAKTVRLKIGSLTNAVNFYRGVVGLIKASQS